MTIEQDLKEIKEKVSIIFDILTKPREDKGKLDMDKIMKDKCEICGKIIQVEGFVYDNNSFCYGNCKKSDISRKGTE